MYNREGKLPIAANDKDWQNLIGIQYALGGCDKQIGLSCYGLIREVYKCLNITMPVRNEGALTGAMIAQEGDNWIKIDEPVPYCVALMRTLKKDEYHFGIVTPDMMLLHSRPATGVVCMPLRRYKHAIVGYYLYKQGGGQHLPDGQGGGDTGRIIGQVVVTLATVATAIFMPELLPAWGPVATGLITAGAAMAVGLAGSMIVNALFPMPQTDTPALSGWNSNSDLSDTRHYTWDGIVNDHRQGLAKAWLFGKMKVGGQIVSEKTWYDADSNEYLDMLICPCKGPVTRFSDVRLNDTEYLYYDSAQIALRPGDDEQALIDMFEKIYTQYTSGAKIPYDASSDNPSDSVQWMSKATITGCRFVITAPRGIYEVVGSTPTARDVVLRAQYKKTSAGSWSFVLGDATTWGSEKPFIHRANGAFTGTSNPYTLTDAGSGGGLDAGFSDRIASSGDFVLVVGGTTYYCTQTGTLSATAIRFNAYTDSGRSSAKTGAFTDGEYKISDDEIAYSVSDFSGRIITGFNINANCTAIKFRLISNSTVDGTTTFTWSKYNVYYRKSGASSWTLVNEYQVGACYYGYYANAYWDIEINGLELGQYEIRINWTNDCCTNPYGTHNVNAFAVDEISIAEQVEEHTISGDTDNPTTNVTKVIELSNLDEDDYQFRIWRTTADETSVYWSDDIYLNNYSEIINAQCAYPGNALIAVRAMATDRLSGSRPTVTALGTGYPLSVPDASNRYDTTVYDDEGLVSGSGNVVNNTNVDGMRKIVITPTLPTPSTEWGEYYWIVRMDTDGYADTEHLFTKWTIRAHTWEHSFVITAANFILTLSYDGGASIEVDITYGDYDGSELAAAIQAAVDAAFSIASTVSFDADTKKITIDIAAGHTIAYTHTGSTAGATCGFTGDHASAQSITSDVSTTPKTRLYIQSTESVPDGTAIMVFHEDNGKYDCLPWAVAKMLINGSRGRITADNIDWDTFADWYDWCEETVDGERRHKFDALVDFSTDLWSIATRAAMQGRGILVACGRKYKVIIDKPVSVPACVFGEGNTKNAKVMPIPRQDRANILVTSYLDESYNYEERTISEEDIQTGESPIVKNLPTLVGVTRETEARRHLQYLLRQNRYIDHMIQFEAGTDSIAIEVGDVFAFQSQANDLAASGKVYGTSGTNLVLDRTFTPDAGESYKI